jgi:uncharacterized membrane protein YadS
MIVPVTLVLAVVSARRSKRAAMQVARDRVPEESTQSTPGTQGKESVQSTQGTESTQSTLPAERFSFVKVFPWFVIGFLAAALISTFAGLPESVTGMLGQIGKFMIVMAMAAIGLGTDLKKLFGNGARPIALGLCCWFAVAATSIAVQLVTDKL